MKSARRAVQNRVPKGPNLCIVRGMNLSPLAVVRLATQRRPSLRDLARKVGCSAALLSAFENGQSGLSPALFTRYCAALGVTPLETRRSFLLSRFKYLRTEMARTHTQLEEMGIRRTGPRRLVASR